MLGCPLAAAAVLSCKVQPDRWIAPHLAVRALFDYDRWESWVSQPVQRTPLWPASWLPVVDKTRGSKIAEVQRVWEVYDERLQFMSRRDASLLDESLGLDDVSLAWAVWSQAAESALADAFRFSGRPVPSRGLILGRGAALLRRVQLGGLRVRRVRADIADVFDAADAFLYCDSSVAPLLDMRRRFKAAMNLLDAMIRYGVSLSRSVELTAQWDQILALGPIYPVTLDDLSLDRALDIGAFFHAASDVHRCLSDSIHQVVVHRRDEAVRVWRNWIREDPLVHPYRWLRPDLVPPAPFLQCEPHRTPGGSGVLSDPARIDDEFRKAWLPYFCRSWQRETSLEEFDGEVDGWLPPLPEVHLPRLTVQVLADVVQRKGATAGGQRPLSVLPVVYRSWDLRAGFRLGFPVLFIVLVMVGFLCRLGTLLLLILKRFLLVLLTLMFTFFVADVVKSFDTVDCGILDCVLSRLGLPGWFRHAYFEYHAHVRLRFKLASGLGEPWTRNGGIPQGCPLSMMFIVALYLDNLKCLSRSPELLLHAVRCATKYVRLVGQEPAPGKCVLLSTSREVRKDMKGWVLSHEGDPWSVKFDVRDLGGHLDTTFRGWSSTLAARFVWSFLVLFSFLFFLLIFMVGCVLSALCIYLLPCMELKLLYLLLRVFVSFVLQCVGLCGLVVSLLQVLALFLAFWMGPLVVILLFFV